jgi:hypothetical protein
VVLAAGLTFHAQHKRIHVDVSENLDQVIWPVIVGPFTEGAPHPHELHMLVETGQREVPFWPMGLGRDENGIGTCLFLSSEQPVI